MPSAKYRLCALDVGGPARRCWQRGIPPRPSLPPCPSVEGVTSCLLSSFLEGDACERARAVAAEIFILTPSKRLPYSENRFSQRARRAKRGGAFDPARSSSVRDAVPAIHHESRSIGRLNQVNRAAPSTSRLVHYLTAERHAQLVYFTGCHLAVVRSLRVPSSYLSRFARLRSPLRRS